MTGFFLLRYVFDLQALRNDVMFHLKDVENVKENAGEVIEVQEDLKPEIQRNVGKSQSSFQH